MSPSGSAGAPSTLPSSSAGLSSTFWQRTIPVMFHYRGRTGFVARKNTAALKFAPSLAREAVFFDAEIGVPLALREAMGALHDVVVSDQRFQKRDRSAWHAYKQRVAAEEAAVRAGGVIAAQAALQDLPPARAELAREFKSARKRYWSLRYDIESRLRAEDPALFRMLVPCDPVVTVAPDAVMFEGFAKDESSYGCVVVDRNAFRGAGAGDAILGTTNVDYSLALAGEMQRLRSYRSTRFAIDPGGIEVETGGAAIHREEKIDLPATWLKGFGQLSAALLLPARHVRLPASTLYSILAHLKTHREKTGPRALRFVLEPGKAPIIIVEPWGLRIESTGPRYGGDDARTETIAVWGRRRLLSLARALPYAQLVDKDACVDVALLGSGMPSLWSVDLGGVRLLLALSGWTTNDWSGGARLDLLASGPALDEALTERIARLLQQDRMRTLTEIAGAVDAPLERVRSSTVRLAQLGQVVPDLISAKVRYRSVIEAPLSAELLGEEPREVVKGKELFATKDVKIGKQENVAGKRHVTASCGGIACEALFDVDGVMSKARCGCSWFHRHALKKGPCRHLLALRMFVTTAVQ